MPHFWTASFRTFQPAFTGPAVARWV
jgi:hypothetical protein